MEFGIEHEFNAQEGQSGQIIMRHEFEESVEFVDTTVRSVVVFVMFGEAESSSFSGLYGDWVNPDACLEFYDQLDDRSYCAIPEVDIDFEDSVGDCNAVGSASFESSGCDRQTTDSRGYATQSVDFGKDKAVKFRGYQDHLFEIWDITEGTTYSLVAAASENPEVRLLNIREQRRLAIVDVTLSRLSARILGGHRNVEFITGQALLVTARTNECGFNKQMVTYRGTVDGAVMPALDVAVEIPRSQGLDDCGDLERPSSRAHVQVCRVPAPVAIQTTLRYSCADVNRLGFHYVDEYFTDKEDQRIQTVDLGLLRDATVSYVYVGPLCLRQVTVGPTKNPLRDIVTRTTDRSDWIDDEPEQLLLMEPEALDVAGSSFGATLVPNDRAIFVEDDEVSLKFELIEVYPNAESTCEWPWDFPSPGCALRLGDATSENSFVLSDVSPAHEVLISYLDGITGTDVMVDAALYNVSDLSNDYTSRPAEFRPGYILDAVAGEPTPFAPFTVDVTVTFHRRDDGSYIEFDRSAILVGVISEAVPQTLTMTTAPTLIFSILRDPPGGTSRTVLEQGAEISTTLSINGMHSASLTNAASSDVNWGVSAGVGTLVAPFGFGVETNLLSLGFHGDKSWSGINPSVSSSRTDAQSIDVTFRFDTEISTCGNPWQAGEPSDVILGGGMNLHIQRAIQVNASRVSNGVYISANTTSEWLMPRVTTFLLSVFEIEELMKKLASQYSLDQDPRSLEAIANWKTVLETYRRSTTTSAESLEVVITGILDHLNTVLRGLDDDDTTSEEDPSLADLQTQFGAATDETYRSFLEQGLRNLDDLGFHKFRPAAENLGTYDRSSQATMEEYLRKISTKLTSMSSGDCASGNALGLGDLCQTKGDVEKKVDLAKNLLGICKFHDASASDDDEYNPLGRFCQTTDGEQLPSRAFDFLDDPHHILTFSGGGSGITMEYEVTQSDSLAHTTSVNVDEANDYNDDFMWCSSILRNRRRLDLGENHTEVIFERRRLEGRPRSNAVASRAEAASRTSGNDDEKQEFANTGACRKLLVDTGHGWADANSDEITVNIGRSSDRSSGHEQRVVIELGDDQCQNHI